MAEKKEIDEKRISDEAHDHSNDLKNLAPSEIEASPELNNNMIAIPAEAIPVNTALPCTVYMKKGDKFLVYRRQADKINYKTALENQKRNTESLYIHKSFWKLFMSSLEHLNVTEKANELEKAMMMRHLLVAYGQELEKQIQEPKKPYFLKMKKSAEVICKTIYDDPKKGAALLRHSDDHMLYFVNHAVNTAIYSTLIGIKVNVKYSELPLLTFAALIHDCGNLLVPRRLIYKREAFTPDEKMIMNEHPQRGANLLNSMQMPGKVVEAVANHHERIDGGGYPAGLKEKDIPLFSKIISIADVFDAMTMNRPYQKAIPAKEALEKMQNMAGKFDSNILNMLKEYKDPYNES